MATATAPRTNRYAGPCLTCGHQVDAEAGLLLNTTAGWKVCHAAGECPDTPAPAAAVQASARANRFAGPCTRCGQRVPAGEGTIAKDGTQWVVTHAGDCPPRSVPVEAPLPDVPEGRYATGSRTGTNDYDFWLVEHGTGRWAGRVFARRIIGGQGPTRIRRDEQATALAAIEAAGVETARDLYAEITRECWACGIELTDGLSRLVKTGPDCCRNRLGMTQRAYARERGCTAEQIAAAVASGG